MSKGRWLVGMELARARSRAAADGRESAAALARAGDAYERARETIEASGEAGKPGFREAGWRALGRAVAGLLALAPGLRRALEERLLAPLH